MAIIARARSIKRERAQEEGHEVNKPVTKKRIPTNEWPDPLAELEGDVAEGYASDDVAPGEGVDAAHILNEILPYIEMAGDAYQDHEPLSNPMVANSKLIRGDRKDTEVHVCLLKDHSVVFAFRGTETHRGIPSFIQDFLTDVIVPLEVVQLYNNIGDGWPAYTSPPDIRAHSGFQAALKSVTDGTGANLLHALKELGVDHAGDVKRVVCVGHSLGGALATLCAKWCREVAFLQAEIGCVTIGSPRVGNAAFAVDFDNRVVSPGMVSYRVVNKKDVVPFLPGLLFPYKHVSRPIYLREDEEGQIHSSLGGSAPTFPSILHGVAHHGVASYMASLSAILKPSNVDQIQ